ncbi:MAG: cell division protein FtsZ [Candidatus Poribacteria bacterium]|nr:cell division protein FtsZ [Candidatus Poribacteria bacterium]
MRYNSSTYTDLTDEELIRLVQDGNEAAFAQLAARHSSRIWQLVVLNARQIRDAEEIFQDIWVAVWENIKGLREINSFGAWLRKIAYTTCRRYYTTNSHTRGEILQSAEQLAETIDRDVLARFRETELRAAVAEAVQDLPERVRAVAVLYYLEVWTIKEIANELGLAVGTVKTRLSQIRTLLRGEFGVEEVKRGNTMAHGKKVSKLSRNKIKVFGVGDAGSNVVKRMIASDLKGIEFYAVNTDLEALRTCDGTTQVQIGAHTTQGLGAAANPEIGRAAAEENLETFNAVVADASMVFVAAGMGGGTGTGAAPLIASIAREQGALTIGVVTLPLDSEGQRRAEQAEYGLHELQENTDAVIVIPNQRLLDTMDAEPSTSGVFHMSDETLLLGIKTVADIIVDSGEVSVDFADIESIMMDAGTVLMGIGHAGGTNRARIAMETAIVSPLLGGTSIGSATGLIVSISAPPDFMMNELDTAMNVLQQEAFDAQIIFGLTYRDDDPEPEGTVYVTLLAAGIEPQSEPSVTPSTQQRGSSAGGDIRVSSAVTSEFIHQIRFDLH